MSDSSSPPPLPLAGVRVLDLSRVFAGPVAGRVLADLGADGGPDLIRELAAAADVVIENFRPGVMKKFGLDWDALSAGHPELVMLSISGFGQDGPESQRAAYASVIHAEAGLVRQDDMHSSAGMPLHDVSFSAADVLSGMHGVIGVMAALRVKDATGIGQHIDLAMVDAMSFSNDNVMYSLDGKFAEHKGGEIWEAAGGPVMLTGGLRWIWHQMHGVHGLKDPTPPDATLEVKLDNRRRVVTEFLCSQPERAAALARLDEANLAWGELRQLREVIESPTLTHRESVATIDDRAGGTREVMRTPYRMSVTDLSDVGHATFRGESNDAVLNEWLGADAAAVDQLRSAEVLLEDEWAAPSAEPSKGDGTR